MRTAERRRGEDVLSGRVHVEPAPQIVERIVRSRYPTTPAGWEKALQEMGAQVADGRLAPWHVQRLRTAVAQLDAHLQNSGCARPPQREWVDEKIGHAVEARISAANGVLCTSWDRLAGDLRQDVTRVRSVVLALARADRIVARRLGEEIVADELATHARVELCLR